MLQKIKVFTLISGIVKRVGTVCGLIINALWEKIPFLEAVCYCLVPLEVLCRLCGFEAGSL